MRRFFLLLLPLLFFVFAASAQADDPTSTCSSDTECEKKIEEFAKKLNELGSAKNTLANQIKIIDSQVQLTLLKITQTQNSIKTLESEIADLTIKIGNLDVSLNQLTSVYIGQVTQNYKLQKKMLPLSNILFSQSFNSFLEQYKYVSVLQKNSQDTIVSMETVRTNYDLQKEEKNKKQIELESLKTKLASQQISLNKQKNSKNVLLESTKNDEKKYQQLLIEAQSQLAALRNFSNSAGGGSCLSLSPSTGSDGNFYSQRDPRWCTLPINPYSLCNGRECSNEKDDDVGHIGCAITSYAIVQKKKGVSTTPSVVAVDKGNFCDSNGNCLSYARKLLINKLQSGYKSYSASVVDSELKAGHYVIAELAAFGGTHFVVIIGGSNGDYTIHDPWYGPDQKLNEHYSTRSINSIRLMW